MQKKNSLVIYRNKYDYLCTSSYSLLATSLPARNKVPGSDLANVEQRRGLDNFSPKPKEEGKKNTHTKPQPQKRKERGKEKKNVTANWISTVHKKLLFLTTAAWGTAD